jgi:hypothetical protein
MGIINNWQIGGAFIFQKTAGNKLQFQYTNVASGISTISIVGTTENIIASQWNHVAVVRNGTTITLYVNGVADATTGNITINLPPLPDAESRKLSFVREDASANTITINGNGATIKIVNHDITTNGGLRFVNFKGCKQVTIDGFYFDMSFTGANTSGSYYPFCGAITAIDTDAAAPDFETLNIQIDDAVTLQVGQEHVIRVKNNSGSVAHKLGKIFI